jgi:transposase
VIGAALEHAASHSGAVVALFQDEASFYRQPTQASLWARMGRAQPHMLWSPRSNTWVRVAAVLDAITGQTYYRQASKITVPQLIKSYQQVLDAYPQALMVYLIQDNWPVHKHPTVMAFLARNSRLQVLFLPTYAPRLNPIEKLWRWAKQTLCHDHPFCDNFTDFKAQLGLCLDDAATKPAYIKHYCGLSSLNLFL